MLSLVKIVSAGAPLAFLLVLLIYWLCKRKGTIVLPFDNATGEGKYNGKAISDSLIAEMQRIRQIHETELEGIKSEKLFLPEMRPARESLDESFTKMGKASLGGTTLSLGGILVALKQIFSFKESFIAGSIQKYGKLIRLVARMEYKHEVLAWEASCEIESDQQVTDLIKDLAYQVIQNFSQKSISVKPWLNLDFWRYIRKIPLEKAKKKKFQAKTFEGFKYFTEALDSYYLYTITRQEKHLETALKFCDKARKEEPKYKLLSNLFYKFGINYIDKNKEASAQEMLRIAFELNPEDTKPLDVLRAISTEISFTENKEILKNLDHAVDNNPRNLEILTYRGEINSTMGRYREAEEDFNEALKLKKDYPKAMLGRGIVYLNQGKCDKAIRNFDKAQKKSKEDDLVNYWVLANRGEAFRKQGEYEKALKNFDDAIEKSKEYGEDLTSKHLEEKLKKDLANYWEHLISRDKDPISKHFEHFKEVLKKDLALISRNKDLTSKHFEEMLKKDLAHYLEHHQTSKHLLEEELTKALANSEYLISRDEDPTSKHLEEELTKALANLDHVISRDVHRDWYYYNRALVYQNMAKKIKGKQEEEQTILKEDAKNDLKEAINIAKSRHQQCKHNCRNTFNLALYLLASENYQEAKSLYLEALSENPQKEAVPYWSHVALNDLNNYRTLFPKQVDKWKDKLDLDLEKKLEEKASKS